jgi:hypothetical protein
VPEDLSDADNGQIFGINDSVAPSGAHPVAADAEEMKLLCLCGDSRFRLSGGAKLRFLPRGSAAQGFDKLRTVHFAGSFPGRDQDSQAMIVAPPQFGALQSTDFDLAHLEFEFPQYLCPQEC